MPVIDDALLRRLPELPDVLARIQSGEYTLHGGVIRHAAGSGKGGQIVGHLIYPSDIGQAQESLQKLQSAVQQGFGSLQGGVDQIQQSINVLQGLQFANLALSGLNLAVSTAGFVIVCQKLNKLSVQIQQQSHNIVQTLQIVGEAHERNLLSNEAQFRALLLTANQFCEQDDTVQLKMLIAPFNREYQFTKLVLEKHSTIAASNVDRFNEIALLQDRFVSLGLMLSHVQMRVDAPRYGQQCLTDMAESVTRLNKMRINALCSDGEVASRVTREHLSDVTSFLEHGKKIVPGLAYQADVLGLEAEHPGLLKKAEGVGEILLLAA